jgi:hypothetical protein
MNLIDLLGKSITEIGSGDSVLINSTIENFGVWEQSIAPIVQVRSENGTNVLLANLTSVLDADGQQALEVPWIPEEDGEYTVSILVVDNLTAASPQLLSETKSWIVYVGDTFNASVLSSDRSTYEHGERIRITIRDPGANQDPTLSETLGSILVYSTTNSGKNFTAEEVEVDSGIFEFSFETSRSAESDKIRVENNDTVTIEYTDLGGNLYTLSVPIVENGDPCRPTVC